MRQFTDKAYSKANREATEAWLNSWMGQIIQDVAAARGLKAKDVCKALHASPLSADEAAAAGLITATGHRSTAMHTLLHSPTSDADPATLVKTQVAEMSNIEAAELSKLTIVESSELKAVQRAVTSASPRDSSGNHSTGISHSVLHSAAEQQNPAQLPVVSPAQSSAEPQSDKALGLADATEQGSGASSAAEQHRKQSSMSVQYGGMTRLQHLQAMRKPLNRAIVVQITPDKLQMKCCLAVPIGKYIQVHSFRCAQSGMQQLNDHRLCSKRCLP